MAGVAGKSYGVLVVAGTGHLVQDNEFRASANGVGTGIKLVGATTNDVLNGNSFPQPPNLNKKVDP